MRFPLSAAQSGLVLLLAVLAGGVGFIPSVRAQDQTKIDLRQFDLLTESSGWVLLDERLFWTSDAGQTWEEIGPSIPSGAVVQDVHFINSDMGWMLLTSMNPDGGALFQLARTIDHGANWTMRLPPLFEPGEIASYAEKAGMGWFDSQTGWIWVKQASGSNFSIGALFTTSDEGKTWGRFALPAADDVHFSDPQSGWAIGGPAGDQVFKSDDGGATWQNAQPDGIHENAQVTTYPPLVSGGQGLLVTTSVEVANRLGIYRLDPASGNWSLFDQVQLTVQPGLIGLSILDPRNFTATVPGTSSIVHMRDGQLDVLENQDGLSASIVALDMISSEVGWAKSVESACVGASSMDDSSASVTCSSTVRLVSTADGGRTWQSLSLPPVQPDSSSLRSSSTSRVTTLNSLSGLGNSQILIGQGFDKCEIPTLSQMQTWWSYGPYRTVNLYIGGSSRSCANSALTSSYLKQLNQQGWKFIPTWVGPQAPCTGFLSRMSSNATTAYNQGVSEADLAVDRLSELGLTYPDKTGSVVYYDIEYYGTDAACRSAVNAFMNGWVSQIHARGNLAGVYGSTLCSTGLSDFMSITNVPDLIWPARWYHNAGAGFYDPNASVWNLGSCLTNTVWANHQRIRQYEGSHNETWGTLTLEIDSDVLDGVVAIPYAPPVATVTRTPFVPTPRPFMKSQPLTPDSLTTESGTTGGSLSSLSLPDQNGAEDNPAAYLSFQTPEFPYTGYRSFHLPDDAQIHLISTMLLQTNFKGPSSSIQTWTWSIYDRNANLWIPIGDTVGASADQWQMRVIRISQPRRYISAGREIRIQLRSNNANGNVKIDYEALHITYLSVAATPTSVAPTVPAERPGIASARTPVKLVAPGRLAFP